MIYLKNTKTTTPQTRAELYLIMQVPMVPCITCIKCCTITTYATSVLTAHTYDVNLKSHVHLDHTMSALQLWNMQCVFCSKEPCVVTYQVKSRLCLICFFFNLWNHLQMSTYQCSIYYRHHVYSWGQEVVLQSALDSEMVSCSWWFWWLRTPALGDRRP